MSHPVGTAPVVPVSKSSLNITFAPLLPEDELLDDELLELLLEDELLELLEDELLEDELLELLDEELLDDELLVGFSAPQAVKATAADIKSRLRIILTCSFLYFIFSCRVIGAGNRFLAD